MAVQKITDMTAITGSNTASDDLFLVIDASTNTAKKIMFIKIFVERVFNI